LIKNKGKSSLKKIKNNAGENFVDDDSRLEFIREEYEKIFTVRPEEEQINFEECIQNFLGPDIIAHPVVQNSFLTDPEVERLDAPLTLEELDESMKAANMRSAAGFDGYSNMLISKCWKFFRLPLLKYFNCCLRKKRLTENFRSACIRLIPKKGDNTLLKNWRPISLLSNMYKILSRAINKRLEKVVNRICSRAQKGYNCQRYTQEVIINVWETISLCRVEGINGALLAIDMAKAFDTLSHKYLKSVFKFFGFGPEICNILDLLGTNRQACIIGDHKNSKYFPLGSGRAQGDNLSPNTFNFGNQILIFKIELDPRIKAIPRNVRNIVNPSELFLQESNRETSKNESMADDNSTLMLIDKEGLQCIKESLDNFASMSGLKCNYDKTVLMPFLDNLDAATVEVLESSEFKMVDSVELLGIKITKKLDSVAENFERIKQKIISKISFWDRFRLSLTGRIAIAKTFMVPLVNYIGCLMEPDPELLLDIQNLIDNFVCKGLRISKARLYQLPAYGGVGMFNLHDFLDSQRFSWIVRAHKLPIDNWRYDLCAASPENNILLIRKCDINAERNPILFEMVKSFDKIRHELQKKNIWDSEIFDNDLFKVPASNSTVNIHFFGRERYERCRDTIRRLKLKECFIGNNVKSFAEFNNLGIPLTADKWLSLVGALNRWKNCAESFEKIRDGDFSLANFVAKLKKGSKKVRHMILLIRNSVMRVEHLISATTYGGLIDCRLPVLDDILLWQKCWTISFLSSDLKTFIYNCKFNCLPLNNRINSYMPEIDARCTFCKILRSDTVQRDGYQHLFFACPTTLTLLQVVMDKLELNFNLTSQAFKDLYWFGLLEQKRGRLVWLLFFDLFRFSLFRFRGKKNIPNHETFLTELVFHLSKLCTANKKFKMEFRAQPELAWFSRAIG
jgi:hypothetical protein